MGTMRWQQLFEDLSARQETLARVERDLEIAEHTRAERGQVALADRLAAGEGAPVRLRVRGLGEVSGVPLTVGLDWLLLDRGPAVVAGRELVVPLAAVLAVEGLTRRADGRPRRLDLRHALRAVSRDRATVRVHLVDGDHLSGTVNRVLADHLDLSRHPDHEPRRAGAVRGLTSLPYAALASVRRF